MKEKGFPRLTPCAPLPIPFDEKTWGVPLYWEAPVPGVYCVQTDYDNDIWVVDRRTDNSLPAGIDQYGVPSPDGKIVYFDYDHGRHVVEYEVLTQKLKFAMPEEVEGLRRTINEVSIYGAERYGSYFGALTPQHRTPWGRVTRYVAVCNGLWFVQAGDRWALSMSFLHYMDFVGMYPSLIASAEGNLGEAPNFTYEDLYWPLEKCAPVLFVLWSNRDVLEAFAAVERFIVSIAALKNYLCRYEPEFTEFYNGLVGGAGPKVIVEQADGDTHYLKLPIGYSGGRTI